MLNENKVQPGGIMDPFDDNHTSKPSDNFAYKDDNEKDELQEPMFSARLSLELKFLMILFLTGVVLGVGVLLYSYFYSVK